MAGHSWHTSTALAWMQTLLYERFGHKLDLLVQPGERHIALRLPGHARCITLALDGVTFTRVDSDLPCALWDASAEGWAAALQEPLPAPGAESLPMPLIAKAADGWHLDYDILGFVYWMLTRQEEVGRTDLDAHERFPATVSHAYRYGYLERPIVDEWLHILGQVIRQTWPRLELRKHQYSIKVSHDVDAPSMYAFKTWGTIARIMAGHLVKRRDLRACVSAPYIKLRSKRALHRSDPYNTFSWLMDLSEANGLQSAFYFICGRTDVTKDAEYVPEHPAIRYLMRQIHARGHEIGLHPSYASCSKPEIIKQEARRLRDICAAEGITQSTWGGRMHYLRWRQPVTLQAWQDADMDYDSTLGYADSTGFRCGTCFEYPAFNPITHKTLKLRIRPLVMMEGSLLDSSYLGMGTGLAAKEKIGNLKSSCKAVGGCFTLLWHNSSLDDEKLRKLYEYSISQERL